MIYCVTAVLVKALRQRTGVGIMECKRALLEENGNLELAVDNLRKNGLTRALEKRSKIASQGSIFVYVNNNIGAILEVNCETDFVARSIDFLKFGKEIIRTAVLKKISNLDILKNTFESLRLNLIAKVAENIIIRRFKLIAGRNKIGSYVHVSRIGVLLNSNLNDLDLVKKIAMHIAASKPEYISIEDIPNDVLDREKKIQLDLVKKSKKSLIITQKIVNGKMSKFMSEISLLEQDFILDTKIKVKDFLNQHSGRVESFVRFELGDSIK
ncbi:Elongation factor Ts [Buchnera aphidicola (Eriosoma grossulariae)]|uniref:translation elongation factor Ts n=1 Tax=Buchnera aphidicola TaxID=9 RepID=UPI00346427E0